MEDNEFEEVTIISHTDHGTSVLPQSTAERLMKEIKLEVTQKISQNENVKLGSLEGSTTPTLLDAIHQRGDDGGIPCSYFIARNPQNYQNGDSEVVASYLFGGTGFTGMIYQSKDNGFQFGSAPVAPYIPHYVLTWGEYMICFWPGVNPSAYNIQTGAPSSAFDDLGCFIDISS